MLGAMDITVASAPAAPWIAVGVLLAVAGFLLAGLVTALVVRRRAAAPDAPPPVDDDLARFLEFPPGTAAPTSSVHDGHVALLAPPASAPAESRRVPASVLATIAGLTALLVAAAVVVALTAGDGSPPSEDDGAGRPADRAAAPQSTEVRMRFAGLVLQQRAVGVQVTYPEVELAADGDGPVARVTLPTWNCMGAEAPDDPEAAGCMPSLTEHAELRPPALEVSDDGDGLRLSGDFPASTRRTGATPEPTGRVYPIEITVTADDEPRSGEWSPASGVFSLDGREAESIEGELRAD
jgi:hypothetical protein